MGLMAKREPAPGWQLPQVWGRFLVWTVELGSEEGNTLWKPWQEEQLATV